MNETTTINDVLSGNAPIKVAVSIDAKSAAYIGIALVIVFALAFAVGAAIYKK